MVLRLPRSSLFQPLEGPADVDGAPVIRQDHAVFFERRQDHLVGGRKAGDIETGIEAQAHTHRRRVGVGHARCPVRCRWRESLSGCRHGESQRVLDCPGGDFVGPRKACENRQPGGIRRSPRVRTLGVDGHVPDHGGIRHPPALIVPERVIEFVEPAAVLIQHEHVPVAGSRVRKTFDQRIARDRHGAGVALVGICFELDGHLRLRARLDLIGR